VNIFTYYEVIKKIKTQFLKMESSNNNDEYWPTNEADKKKKRSPKWTSAEYNLITAAAKNMESIDSLLESFRLIGSLRSKTTISFKLKHEMTLLKKKRKVEIQSKVPVSNTGRKRYLTPGVVSSSNAIFTWADVQNSTTSAPPAIVSPAAPKVPAPIVSSPAAPKVPAPIVSPAAPKVPAPIVSPAAPTVPAPIVSPAAQIEVLGAELKMIEELNTEEVFKTELRISWINKLKLIVNQL
jgi:hypothetical protein